MNTDFMNTYTLLTTKGYIVNQLFPYSYIYKFDVVVTANEIREILDIYGVEYTGIEQIGTMVVISYE